MVNINLLPQEIKLKIRQAKNNADVFSICLVCILTVSLIGFALFELRNNYLQMELNNTKSDVSRANGTLAPFDKLENEALFINERAQLSQNIETKRAVWSEISQELINSVPADVQFVSLHADLGKTPNFELQGITASEREAIKFKDKLESSIFFKDVAFKSSSVTSATGTANANQTLNFTLELDLERLSVKNSNSGGTK